MANEQINETDRLDKVRVELDGKIGALDVKLEGKVSEKIFFWILGVLVLILITVLGSLFYQIIKTNDNVDSIKNRVTIIETKIAPKK